MVNMEVISVSPTINEFKFLIFTQFLCTQRRAREKCFLVKASRPSVGSCHFIVDSLGEATTDEKDDECSVNIKLLNVNIN